MDADRIPIRRSATINNVEQVSLNEFVPGTYYVRVFGYGSATNTFSLTIEAPAGDIPQDAYEANNQLENASNLGTLQGVNEYGQLTIHNSDDRDFYKFTTAATGRADDSIRLNFVHARGDLDVRLRNSSGVVIASSSSVRDFEEISLKGLPADTYSLEVYGFQGQTSPRYSLRVQAPRAIVAPDPFEPNNAREQAASVPVVQGRAAFSN